MSSALSKQLSYSNRELMEPNLESALRPSTAVRDVQNEDGAVLLDIQQGLCLSMTPIGLKIWQMLKLRQSISEIVNSLSTEFPVVRKEQIQGDVVEFVADLRRKGLLVSSEPIQRAELLNKLLRRMRPGRRTTKNVYVKQGKPRFLFWRAFLGLLAFDLLRFGRNFTRLHSLVQSWGIAPMTSPTNTVELVCRAVNYACVWYPKPVLCLQRSAVTTCLLRSCGLHAQMVMGAQKFPFRAHAWTEVDKSPINERTDVQQIYMVWERC